MEYNPQYLNHYYRLEKTSRDKWFELCCKEMNSELDFILKVIRPITWLEMLQPQIGILQIGEMKNNKLPIRVSFSEKNEKYFIGKFQHFHEISLLVIENDEDNFIELFFSNHLQNNYIELLRLFQEGELNNEILFLRNNF